MDSPEADHQNSNPPARPSRVGRWLGIGSLVGLALGILLGGLAASVDPSRVEPWLRGANTFILAWTNALRLLVLPVVVSQLYLAITKREGDARGAAKLGMVIPVVFAGLLCFTALVGLLVASGLLTLPWFRDLSLADTGSILPQATAAVATAPGDASWVNDLVPSNLIAAAGGDNILPLMLVTLAFAFAARRLATELQGSLGRGFAAVGGASFVLIDWLMRPAPFVLLALAFRTAYESGFTIGGVVLAYAAFAFITHSLATLALYPVGVLIGGVPLRALARAAYRPQLIAASTRSSLATIPALLEVAEKTLRIPPAIGSLVIPIGGATLKLSRAASASAKLLFLAHIVGLHLGLEQLVIFIVTVLLVSPATAGIPRVVSSSRSLPAYVAVGIPPQYVLMLGATNAVTDVVMTILNTTGYLISTVLVRRFGPKPAKVHATEPAPVDPLRRPVAPDFVSQ